MDKEKKQGENNGKKDTNPKPKTESQERRDVSAEARKRNLSQMKDTSSPVRQHNSFVQIQVQKMGNHPSRTHSDSDEEDYETPPETLDSDTDLEEENDDPNVLENI